MQRVSPKPASVGLIEENMELYLLKFNCTAFTFNRSSTVLTRGPYPSSGR